MPDLLLTAIEYSSYISIVKVIIFMVLFFLWLPVLNWVFEDAKAIGTNEVLWTGIVLGTWAAAAVIWLVVPLFVMGVLFYLIAAGASSLGYVMHRNARVAAFDRVLTVDHIKGLLVTKEKELDTLKGFVFITANNNEVPMPQPKTPDFFGYKSAYNLFTDAMWRRAQRVMFSPATDNYSVTYYIDGAALKQPTIGKDQMEYLIHFLKDLADLNVEEKRKPQKGKFTISQQGKKLIDWEVATAGSTAGEQIRLKQLTQKNITSLSDIGLTQEQYEQLNKISELKQGLFIIAGPKKSGATNTFYSLLRNHDAFINGICTLEKRPSADLLNITQNVYSLSDTGTTTYAKKLQHVVRMGPDIVGVANCEDSETAQVTAKAALDGKIVYVELKADNVVKTLGKWMKLVSDRNLALDGLIGISCQRLLRKLCEKCKEAYEPKKEVLRKFNLPAEKAKVLYRAGKVQYSKHGKPRTCENCQGTGFVGRTGVFEIIMIDDELRRSIKESKSLSEIDAQFKRAKMAYLQERALKNVIDGETAMNEVVQIFSKSKKKKEKPEQKT